MAHRIGIDTGGTFTDLVAFDEDRKRYVYSKQSSTPENPARAVDASLGDISADKIAITNLVLGTTVATNTILQRRGSRPIFITTAGFEDIPFIGRLDKEELYNLHWRKPAPLVSRQDCFGIGERIDHHGQVVIPLTMNALEALGDWIRERLGSEPDAAFAVCLLFSYLNPEHERQIGAYLHDAFPDLPVSLSHQISPMWREYERSSTTIGDAYVKPVLTSFASGVRHVLDRRGIAAPASLLKSNGGHLGLDAAGSRAAQFLLSGLAGGIVAARYYAGLAGAKHAFSLDMGGTSADIGTIQDAQERYLSEFQVEFGIPIAIPCVDVATLGAGGGSIAWIDKGGMLQVGPRSAGAIPGPMCYCNGGKEPTTTDANLALGRLNPHYFLGGRVPLDLTAANDALSEIGHQLGAPDGSAIEVASHAIVDMANEHMANQIKLISVERGLDPREFALIAFGGAGPVHGSACARLLGIQRVLVPPHPGLTSAFGALTANWRVDRSRTIFERSHSIDTAAVSRHIEELSAEALRELYDDVFSGEPILLRSIDMRYAGQNYEREVSVPPGEFNVTTADQMIRDFSKEHERFYGFSLTDEPVEFVNVRIAAIGPVEIEHAHHDPEAAAEPSPIETRQVSFRAAGFSPTPVYRRDQLPYGFGLDGPAIIEEMDSTTVVEPGDRLEALASGLLEITLASDAING